MNLSVISKKFKEYPILFVCGIITPVALVLLFMRAPKIEEYETQLEDLERTWNDIQKNVERSAGLESDIESLETGLEAINERLMRVENVAVNSEFFYDLEEAVGVQLGRFTQGEAGDGSNLHIGMEKMLHFSTIPYNLNIGGTMEEVLSFISSLDRQDYIVRLESLRLAPASSEDKTSQQLSARLQCHVLAEKHE